MAVLSTRVQRWADRVYSGLHRGVSVTSATGVATIDLGINHNNFAVTIELMGGATELANGYVAAWDYGTRRGTFVVTLFKRPAAYGAWIAATAAVRFSFIVHADTPFVPVT